MRKRSAKQSTPKTARAARFWTESSRALACLRYRRSVLVNYEKMLFATAREGKLVATARLRRRVR